MPKTYLITMPDTWEGDCETCPHSEKDELTGCSIYNCQADFERCPLANAVEAYQVPEFNQEIVSMMFGTKVPVKLWSTEIKK